MSPLTIFAGFPCDIFSDNLTIGKWFIIIFVAALAIGFAVRTRLRDPKRLLKVFLIADLLFIVLWAASYFYHCQGKSIFWQ